MENIYTFKKEKSGRWYIDLPHFDGPKEALEMVEGADTMLELILNIFYKEGEIKIALRCETEPFEGSNELIKKDVSGDESKTEIIETVGGMYYDLSKYNGLSFNAEMWLCDVTLYVFGKFPEKIYINHVL